MSRRIKETSQAASAIFESLDYRLRNPVGLVVRFSGYVILLFVLYCWLTFPTLPENFPLIWAWWLTYLIYILALEIVRNYNLLDYDARLFRFTRILVNLFFISALIYNAPQAAFITNVLYWVPLSASIVYFPTFPWVSIATVLLSITWLLITTVLCNEASLTMMQFALITALHCGVAIVLRYFHGRALTSTSILVDNMRNLYNTLDLDKLLSQILEESLSVCHAEQGLILVIEPKTKRYLDHAFRGLSILPEYSLNDVVENCFVLKTGEAYASSDFMKTYPNHNFYLKYFGCNPGTILAEPIARGDGTVIGVLNILHEKINQFDPITKILMRQFTLFASNAVTNSIDFRETQIREARNRIISDRLADAQSEAEVVQLMIEEAIHLIPAASECTLHKLDYDAELLGAGPDSTGFLLPWASSKIPLSEIGKTPMSFGKGIAGHALKIAEPIRVNNVTEHPWFIQSSQEESLKSLLVAPLAIANTGEKIGTLSVNSTLVNAFTTEDEAALASLAHQGAQTINKIRSYARWREHGGLIAHILDEVRFFDLDYGDEHLCQQITQAATRLLGFRMARLRLYDPKTEEMVTIATDGIPDEHAEKLYSQHTPLVNLSKFLSPKYKVERSFIIPHDDGIWNSTQADDFYIPEHLHQKRTGWRAHDAILTPIMSPSGQMLALLTMDDPLSGSLPTPQDIEAVGVFASAAAWSLELARERQRLLEQQLRTWSFIRSLSNTIQFSRDPYAIGEVVVQVGANLISSEGCSFYLVQGGHIVLINSSYLANTDYINRQKPISDHPGCGLTSYVAKRDEILMFSNYEHKKHPAWAGETAHLRYIQSGECRSLLISPIHDSQKKVIGIITLENKKNPDGSESFSEEDKHLLVDLCDQVGSAFEMVDRYESIQKWERKGLEDDLHELINWFHSGVVAWLDSLKYWWDMGNYQKVAQDLPVIQHRVHTTVDELKTIHTTISSEETENDSFAEALHRTAEAWSRRISKKYSEDLPLSVICPFYIQVPPHVRNIFVRIATSALANSLLHSGIVENPEIKVEVRVEQTKDQLLLQVKDTGRGMGNAKEGYGIVRMRRLVALLNHSDDHYVTSFEIQSPPEGGTLVQVCRTAVVTAS